MESNTETNRGRKPMRFPFDGKSVWKYEDETIKAFVPKVIVDEFEKFLKKGKINFRPCNKYTYCGDKKKKTKAELGFIEGMDYIIEATARTGVEKFLKEAYKEANKKYDIERH